MDAILSDVARAAKELRSQLAKLRNYAGGYPWEGVNVDEVGDALNQMIALCPPPSDPSHVNRRGQPPKVWHDAARQFAPLVIDILHGLGYGKNDTTTRSDASATAHICAEALSWAYSEKITSGTFVTAMRDRDRSKNRPSLAEMTYDQIFPDAPSLRRPYSRE